MYKRGIGLVETLVYVAVLAVIFVVVVNTILFAMTAWGKANAIRALSNEGGNAMERILREIRSAESVLQTGSVFDLHPGVLRLNTTVSPTDETPIVREFSLSSDLIMLTEGILPSVPLTSGIKVTNLVFYFLDNGGTSEAVRIDLTIEKSSNRFTVSRNFSGTAVLRGSY